MNRFLLNSIFALKGNFAPGLQPPARVWEGIEVTPFLGGARASATISADFEIAWAFRGRSTEERHLRGTRCRKNVPDLVRMLEERSIPITWATVGHLFLESCERGACGLAHANMPRPPKNERWEGDWYRHDPCTHLKKAPHWYAPDLIQGILDSRTRHEMGSHSYSHIDFSKDTSTAELVRREMEACAGVMAAQGLPLRSLVYPFNNMGHHYLDLLAGLGITAVRHRDAQVRLSYPERSPEGVYKLCESMNLRRAGRYDYVDKVKMFVEEAMKRHAAYHIWFHPSDPTDVFEDEFRRIIYHLADLRDAGVLWVATMGELAAYCEARNSVSLDVLNQSDSLRIAFNSTYDSARYGHTIVTLKVPVRRPPGKCCLTTAGGSVIPIEGRPDPHGGIQPSTWLFDVPHDTKCLEISR